MRPLVKAGLAVLALSLLSLNFVRGWRSLEEAPGQGHYDYATAGRYWAGMSAYDRFDYATALRLMRPFADQGNARAQYIVGRAYQFGGRGVPQDDAGAVLWFRNAAEQGHPDARFQLGVMYDNGRGVPQDHVEAVRWFRMAADQGDVVAQRILGLKYEFGEGVPQDDAEAVEWYLLAAGQGDDTAQYSLGLMYQNGKGAPQNYAEAVKWFRKRADHGAADAELILGLLYAEGQGVPQNYVQAHMWLNLAAAGFSASETENRNRALAHRDSIAKKMTSTQIAEAQRLARRWKAK